jgi:hypothetical protein
MFTTRLGLRAARAPIARQTIGRRMAHTESKLPAGYQDNAFNRERQAVKDHAAATSGECLSFRKTPTTYLPYTRFVAQAFHLVSSTISTACLLPPTPVTQPLPWGLDGKRLRVEKY